jgi:hypothetical protein
MATSRDIDFDAQNHTYRLMPSGLVLPSVTGILKATGVSTDFEGLGQMSGRIAEAIAAKRDLGVAVHSDAHAFDDGDLYWPTVHPDVLPYLEAWATFREHKELTPVARERIVYDPHQGYVGMLDGIFASPAYDQPILIDLKLGDPRDAAAQYQTVGYLSAYAIEHPAAHAYARWSVQLLPERRVPYEITPYADYKDFEVWRAIVTTFYAARRAA